MPGVIQRSVKLVSCLCSPRDTPSPSLPLPPSLVPAVSAIAPVRRHGSRPHSNRSPCSFYRARTLSPSPSHPASRRVSLRLNMSHPAIHVFLLAIQAQRRSPAVLVIILQACYIVKGSFAALVQHPAPAGFLRIHLFLQLFRREWRLSLPLLCTVIRLPALAPLLSAKVHACAWRKAVGCQDIARRVIPPQIVAQAIEARKQRALREADGVEFVSHLLDMTKRHSNLFVAHLTRTQKDRFRPFVFPLSFVMRTLCATDR